MTLQLVQRGRLAVALPRIIHDGEMPKLKKGLTDLRLCVLAFFTPAAIPGLTIGCLLYNISFAGALPLDPVLGTAATLLAAGGMWLTRKVSLKGLPLLGLLMPAVTNAFLVGWELELYMGGGFWINALYVAIGEIAVLLTLGTALYYALKPQQARLFG